MKKGNVLYFLAGTVFGAASAWIVFDRLVVKKMDERVNECIEFNTNQALEWYQRELEALRKEQEESREEPAETESYGESQTIDYIPQADGAVCINKEVVDNPIDYSKKFVEDYYDGPKPEVKFSADARSVPSEVEVINVFEEAKKRSQQNLNKPDISQVGKKPYQIEPEKFGDEADYDLKTLVYHQDQDILEEDGHMLNEGDIEAMVGPNFTDWFGDYEDDACYVRNEGKKTDYEILVSYEDFEARY